MHLRKLILTAALAAAAGLGAGFSGTSYAIDPVCRGDCADLRQGCNFNCTTQACFQGCYNQYQACIAACPP
jgi:hypothetical protein